MADTVYDYITLANLEDFTGLNYDGINATQFSDARVNATIGVAERIVNSYLGVTSAQTITDGIITTTILIAAKLMYKKMNNLGYTIEGQEENELVQLSLRSILRMFLGTNVGVDSIPMSGADN